MPFTLAHPVIVLPLSRSKYLSATALIAGSIVPDFEFFFQLREVKNIGHSWVGIPLFDVPVALLFCFIFHGIVKKQLIMNLPAYFRKRFIRCLAVNWNEYIVKNKLAVLASVLIGILTHILWDGLTHKHGMFTEKITFLQEKVEVLSAGIPVYFLLQLIFSAGGLLIMALVVHQLPVQNNVTGAAGKPYWMMILLISSLIIIIRVTQWPQYNNFWSLVMAFLGGVTYALLFTSLFFKTISPFKNQS